MPDPTSPTSGPFIRDELVIDQRVQRFYDEHTDGGAVYLLGRVVRHAQPLRLRPDRPLVVVADLYDGTGGGLDASGTPGGGGGRGPDGAGYGAPGGTGGAGGTGGPGGTVTVYCRRSVNAAVSVRGGNGGPGGPGGNGAAGRPAWSSPGTDVWVDDTPDDLSDSVGHYEHVDGESDPGVDGGRGGWGGRGGTGGVGGTVTFTSTADDAPTLDAGGGWGPPGGGGGTSGMYAPPEEDGGTTAPSGPDGDTGAAGTVTVTTVSEADFVAGLRPVLGIYANYWAPYRLVVADWFHHAHNPDVPERAGHLQLAAVEVTRTLELQPDNAAALAMQTTLLAGRNALGLDPDLDVLPSFDDYIRAYTAFSALALNFVTSGTGQVVDALTLGHLASFADVQRLQAQAARDDAVGELGLARTEEKLAQDETDAARERLDQATADIQAELEAMERAKLESDGILGTVAEVGLAVVAVVAAIPSGGTSLVALVPAIVGLAGAVMDNAGPIANAVMNGTDADVSAVKAAYAKVGKAEPAAVVKGVKSIVDFVKVVEKLTAATTPDNAKYVALVRRGAELTHEALLAGRRAELASARVATVQQQIDRAQVVVDRATALQAAIGADAAAVQQAGLLMVAAAEACADTLLGLAFRAQRSVEIYTLQDEGARVLLDTGRLHPDRVREFGDGYLPPAGLVAELQRSWSQLLQPALMQGDYTSWFDTSPDEAQHRLTFAADSPEVAALRDSGVLSFRVSVDDLPAGRYDAKVTGVRVALVGAAHPDGEVTVQLRHGAQYLQRRPSGEVAVQLLSPITSRRTALLTTLPPDPGLGDDPPLTAPKALRFWGRGLAGSWELSVAPESLAGLDLSGLTAVQVWLAYQSFGA